MQMGASLLLLPWPRVVAAARGFPLFGCRVRQPVPNTGATCISAGGRVAAPRSPTRLDAPPTTSLRAIGRHRCGVRWRPDRVARYVSSRRSSTYGRAGRVSTRGFTFPLTLEWTYELRIERSSSRDGSRLTNGSYEMHAGARIARMLSAFSETRRRQLGFNQAWRSRPARACAQIPARQRVPRPGCSVGAWSTRSSRCSR